MEQRLNLSIVIPTNGRVSLVERLLKSLISERKAYPYGETEVLIVNSGDENDAEQIEKLCHTYQADIYSGREQRPEKKKSWYKKCTV